MTSYFSIVKEMHSQPLFSLYLMDRPIKLEYYTTLGLNSLTGSDTSFLGPFVSYEEYEAL